MLLQTSHGALQHNFRPLTRIRKPNQTMEELYIYKKERLNRFTSLSFSLRQIEGHRMHMYQVIVL